MKVVDLLKHYGGSEIKGEVDTSGPWGASLFGDKAAISALKVGEQYGISEYKEALKDNSINLDLKRVIGLN